MALINNLELNQLVQHINSFDDINVLAKQSGVSVTMLNRIANGQESRIRHDVWRRVKPTMG